MMKKNELKLLGRLNVKIIMIVITITAAVSLIIACFLYSYFYDIEVERVTRIQQTKFSEYIDEINQMYHDVHRLERTLSIQEDIQEYLAQPSGVLSQVDENVVIRKIVSELTRSMMQYESVSSIALVKNGELSGWTEVTFFDEQSREISENWFQAFLSAAKLIDKPQEVIGGPYTFTLPTAKSTKTLSLISIQIPVYSIKGTHNSYGSLIINLDASIFLSILDGEKEFNAMLLEGSDGSEFVHTGNMDCLDTTEHSESAFPLVFTGITKFDLVLKAVYEKPLSFQMSGKDTMNLIVVMIGAVLGIILLISITMIYLLRPVKVLLRAMDDIGKGNLDLRVRINTGDEFELLGSYLNRMTEELNRNFSDRLRAEEETHEMEYALLVAQINPHFIYNTLNTVIYLACKERSRDVVQLTRALIELLQSGIKLSGNRNFATVEEELAVIRNYVLIQNYRYCDKFLLEIECDDKIGTSEIPTSIIQPFLENALFHGIVPLERKGTVTLSIKKVIQNSREGLEIRLSDDGVGMSEEKLEMILSGIKPQKDQLGNHIGIDNVLSRLKLLYGDACRFSLDSEMGKGTRLSIFLPKKEEK